MSPRHDSAESSHHVHLAACPTQLQTQDTCAQAGASGPCRVGQGLALVPHVSAAPLANSCP